MSQKYRPTFLNKPWTRAAFASLVFCACSSATAAGLGDIRLYSGLNEPLDAEISLLDVKEDNLSDLKASLGSEASYSKLGIDRNYELTQIRFLVTKNAKGEPVLKLSSVIPLKEAYLDMLITLEWPTGNMARDYTVLLDPPTKASKNYQDYAKSNKAEIIYSRDKKPPSIETDKPKVDQANISENKLKAIESKIESMTKKFEAIKEDNAILQAENKRLEEALTSKQPAFMTKFDSDPTLSPSERRTEKAAAEAIESLIDTNKLVLGSRGGEPSPAAQTPKQDPALDKTDVGLDMIAADELKKAQERVQAQGQPAQAVQPTPNTNVTAAPAQAVPAQTTTQTAPSQATGALPKKDAKTDVKTDIKTDVKGAAQTKEVEPPPAEGSFPWFLSLLVLLFGAGGYWYYQRTRDEEYEDLVDAPEYPPDHVEETTRLIEPGERESKEEAATTEAPSASTPIQVSAFKPDPSTAKNKKDKTSHVNPLRQSIIDDDLFNIDEDNPTLIDEKEGEPSRNVDDFILQLNKDVDVYLQFERYDQAETVLKSMLERKNDFHEARFKLLGLYILLKKYEEAEAIYAEFPKNLKETQPLLWEQAYQLYSTIKQAEQKEQKATTKPEEPAIDPVSAPIQEQTLSEALSEPGLPPKPVIQEAGGMPTLDFVAPQVPAESRQIIHDDKTLEVPTAMPSLEFEAPDLKGMQNNVQEDEFLEMPGLEFSQKLSKSEPSTKLDTSLGIESLEDNLGLGMDAGSSNEYEVPEYELGDLMNSGPEIEVDFPDVKKIVKKSDKPQSSLTIDASDFLADYGSDSFLQDSPDVIAEYKGLNDLTQHEEGAVLAREIPLEPLKDCGQKLALARLCLDSKDIMGARKQLEQVIAFGTKDQQDEAKKMMQECR